MMRDYVLDQADAEVTEELAELEREVYSESDPARLRTRLAPFLVRASVSPWADLSSSPMAVRSKSRACPGGELV